MEGECLLARPNTVHSNGDSDFLGGRCAYNELVYKAIRKTGRECLKNLLRYQVKVEHRDNVAYIIACEASAVWGYSRQETEALLKAMRETNFEEPSSYTNDEIAAKVRRAQMKKLKVPCGKSGKLGDLLKQACNKGNCLYHMGWLKARRERNLNKKATG